MVKHNGMGMALTMRRTQLVQREDKTQSVSQGNGLALRSFCVHPWQVHHLQGEEMSEELSSPF